MTKNNIKSDEIGQILKKEREYRGFSKQEIADYIGLSQTEIEEIEKGQRKISSDKLERLAEIYELSVSQLRDDPENEDPDEELEMLARSKSDLSEKDRTEIQRFAKFLKSRQDRSGSNE